ncbi:hypothetical protein F0562_021159 [Nyssa sinensis]|uniref:Uncharacterized protein n=1 Tax=Nyssa sinensis TaxID=561372 RepID=A0A5J5BL19_9ASTE|nr:hypothetical protein F0562_021159 [Nyssa sinensis]
MARSLSTALSPQRGDIRKKMSLGAFHGLGELKGLTQEDGFRVFKKREIVGLDLNMSLLGDAKEDLDLELRLGFFHWHIAAFFFSFTVMIRLVLEKVKEKKSKFGTFRQQNVLHISSASNWQTDRRISSWFDKV